jgi:hypothetical protein
MGQHHVVVDGEVAFTVHHQDHVGGGGQDRLIRDLLIAVEPHACVDAACQFDDAFGR